MTLTKKQVREITESMNATDTIGDVMKVIFSEADNGEENLKVAMTAYANNIHKFNPERTMEECVDASRQNVNYMLGYYDDEESAKVKRMLELPTFAFLGNVEVITY